MGAYGPPAGFYRNKPGIKIDYRYCVGCLRCVEVCPQANVLRVVERGAVMRPRIVELDACAGCGGCVRACPTHAIGLFLR